MGRLVGWIPATVRLAVGMLFVGGVVGFALAAAGSTVVADQGWFSGSGESAQARTYMIRLLSRDAAGLNAMRPEQDVISRALSEQSAQQSQQSNVKALSLTYLGGQSQGGLSVHIYAVEVQGSGGRQQLFPLALTLSGGRVVLTR